MPAHPVALELIRSAGVPIAGPSANRFTELSPTTAGHVRASLGDRVDLILDAGPAAVGLESTVLSLAGEAELLRPGMVTRDEIESLIGPVRVASEAGAGPHRAPGMHPRHYSPRTPLILIREGSLPESGRGAYLWLTAARPAWRAVQMPASARRYAAELYEVLHRLDAQGLDWIAVEEPPRTPEWEAIHDRLRRMG